jgi:thiosulfate/3-mercaptopyruvate sulfurtransferase
MTRRAVALSALAAAAAVAVPPLRASGATAGPGADAPATASSKREDVVVTPEWLLARLKSPDLVLLHVGDEAGYAKGHLPGARRSDMGDVSIEHDATNLMLQMPDAEDLRRRLEALGISDRSQVVVYYATDWVADATRLLFALDHAGLEPRAVLLDGGLSAWTKAGGPLSTEPAPARRGSLSRLRTRDLVVDQAYVRAHLGRPGFAVVDGRAAAYYDGRSTGGMMGQRDHTGHIAGALSIPFTSITDERMRIRPAEELAALFAKAGVKPGDTVIGYCHIGMQATEMLMAARTLGHAVRLYDGSFQEWSRRADAPVANPAGRR